MDAALSDRLCRNRYIVECKGIYHILAHIRQIRRNRYIVECKDRQAERIHALELVEIDTLWNVKTH